MFTPTTSVAVTTLVHSKARRRGTPGGVAVGPN